MADITIQRPAARLVRAGGAERARFLLRADAALCAASGVVLLAAAAPIARLADGDPVGVVQILGAVLLAWAVDLVALSRVRTERVALAARVAGGAGLAWVAATVAVTAAGWLEPGGIIVALAVAVAVGELAWMQLRAAAEADRVRRLSTAATDG